MPSTAAAAAEAAWPIPSRSTSSSTSTTWSRCSTPRRFGRPCSWASASVASSPSSSRRAGRTGPSRSSPTNRRTGRSPMPRRPWPSRDVATDTEGAYAAGGAAEAARTFMRGVAGSDAWDRLPDRTRTFLEGEGVSAYVDAGLRGLDPAGLARIASPTTILTGDASEPFYRPIAEALAERIPGARHVSLPRMTHPSPITDPGPVAAAVIDALAAAGVIPPSQPSAPPRSPEHEPSPGGGAVGTRHRTRECRLPGRGRGDVRPHRARLRPDEPGHLRLPGAALAEAGGQAGGRPPGRPAARRRDRHGQGRGRPVEARPAGRRRPGGRHLAGHDPGRPATVRGPAGARLRRR